MNPTMLVVHGAVIQEDGTPAPQGTRVECACSSRTKRAASVDSRGFFSLQINNDVSRYNTLAADLDDEPSGHTDISSGKGGRRLGLSTWVDAIPSASVMGCELRATLAGFRSNTLSLEDVKNLGQVNVGTIILYPIERLRGTLVSVTSLQAPKEARKALERAKKSIERKNPGRARQELKTAIQTYPKYADAWFALGEICEREGNANDARDAYQSAVAADAICVKPYVALARLAGVERRWKEVAELTDRALSLDPMDFPEAYYLNSIANLSLKELDSAEKSARMVLRLDPLHRWPAAYLVLAEILEEKSDFTGSIEQLESYLQVVPNGPSSDQVRARIKDTQNRAR